jgi:ketosteroid isomerase-like protein
MKRIIPIVCLFISCNTNQDLSKQAAEEIKQADIDMNTLAAKEGFYKALLYYADDSIVKPQEGILPVVGKAALEKYWNDKPDTKDISWQPFKAEAAKSGDLGYTLGTWKFTAKDTVMYGMYYTIWKKQADGKWKFTIDGGNNTPKP